ncbi:hypothetical protein [Ancrocorticia populi]|uniref:Uncharacterized protein n=1 Tax=Ancrocorticia populi TaxID=2175228 RepID=A0A2V1K3X7_9ACTO|nr:hypothetical protein [Ancrocorticia populi]MDN6486302.1 hypothetical protein [Ancrocorticia sp.]PWF25781.1 hypothetical protein DD236_10105 [Ancrocorticia populi]
MKIKRSIGIATFAFGSLAIVGSAVASPSLQETQHSLEVADLTPAITQLAADQATVPDWLVESGVDPESIRNVGTSEFGEHWIASDPDGNICIATQLGEESQDNWIGSVGCTSPMAFYEHGAAVSLNGEGFDGTAAYMLPPDIDSSTLTSSKDVQILADTPQVIAVSSIDQSAALRDIEIPRADGTAVQLPELDTE